MSFFWLVTLFFCLLTAVSISAVPLNVATGALYQSGYGLLRQRWQLDPLNSTLGTFTRYGTVREVAVLDAASPDAPAAAWEPSLGVFTMNLYADGWRVCKWLDSSDGVPICSQQPIAPLSSGVPTSMISTGSPDYLLIIAFPEVGDILACSATSLTPWTRKWATGLATPTSLAYNPATSTVYVALLNGDTVARYDSSGGSLDDPMMPWLTVARPRFVLSNIESALDPEGPTFVVMSMSADGTELLFMDYAGNAIGSVTDLASEWVCDEPGQDENTNSIARVTSIAYNSLNSVLYLTREGGYDAIDTYRVSTVIPDDSPIGVPSLSSVITRRPLGLITSSGWAFPIGFIDSYQAYIAEDRFVVYLQCNGNAASGATTERPLGLLLCGAETLDGLIQYSNKTVYSLVMNEVANSVCFSRYLYVLSADSTETILDTYLSNSSLYVLHSSGRVVRLSNVCDTTINTAAPIVELQLVLNQALLSVPDRDFVVMDNVPCVATRYGLACSGGSIPGAPATPICQQLAGALLSNTQLIFLESVGALIVFGNVGNSYYIEVHTYVNTTYTEEECYQLSGTPPSTELQLVADTLSGTLGWIDQDTGALYEINAYDQLEMVVSSAVMPITGLPSDMSQWSLRDPFGLQYIYPLPTTVAPASSTPTTTKEPDIGDLSKGMVIILVLIVALILMLGTVCIYLIVAGLRRLRRWPSSSGHHVHSQGHGSTTYSEEELEEASRFILPPGWRRMIRRIFCLCDVCYNSRGSLRCCGSCLGGRIKPPYAKMVDNNNSRLEVLSSGEDLPYTAGSGSPYTPVNVGDSDARTGGEALENVSLRDT